MLRGTVEPGQPWDRNYWPDNPGGHISGVNLYQEYILYTLVYTHVYVIGTISTWLL